MTLDISDFVPRSLVEKDEYIEVADSIFNRKKTGKVQINMHDDNGKPLITTFYNVIFDPDLCDRLFFIVTLIHL